MFLGYSSPLRSTFHWPKRTAVLPAHTLHGLKRPKPRTQATYSGCLSHCLLFPLVVDGVNGISRTNNGATDEEAGPFIEQSEQTAAYEGTARHLLSRATPEAIEATIPPIVVFLLHTVIRKPRTRSADLAQHKPYPYTPLPHSQDTHVLEFRSARDEAETDICEFEVSESRRLPCHSSKGAYVASLVSIVA